MRPAIRPIFLFLLPLLAFSAQTAPGPQGASVGVEMHNVFYHFTPQIAVHIRDLRGELEPKGAAGFPVFDDKDSFVLHLRSAEISISTASMAAVLNDHVFAAHDAPLKQISLAVVTGRLKVKGRLHNQGDIPFETEATLSVTPEGKIQMRAEKIRALHLPVKGLMDLFGIEIADLIKTNKVKGLRAEKDDLILDATEILPPPQIEGRVSTVRLEGDNIVQTFGPAPHWRPTQPGNYMAYRGNRLRFGKLTMADTDMVLLDMDPGDPFDFSLDRYKEQLTAGYTKITPTFRLRVYMRDLNKLQRGQTKAGKAR